MMTYEEMVEAGREFMRAELALHHAKKDEPKVPEHPFSIESQADIDAYDSAYSAYAEAKRAWELRVDNARERWSKARSKVLDGYMRDVWVVFECDSELISLKKTINGVNRDVLWQTGKATKNEEQSHD